MPLNFPRSKLTEKGTTTVEGKEVVGESHSIFSKVKGWEGNKLSVFQGQIHRSIAKVQFHHQCAAD